MQETNSLFQGPLSWSSGTYDIASSDGNQIFHVGIFNAPKEPDDRTIADIFDPYHQDLDGILVLSDNVRQTQSLINEEVFCDVLDQDADCPWNEVITPRAALSEEARTASAEVGPLLNLNISIGGGDNEQTLDSLLGQTSESQSLAQLTLTHLENNPQSHGNIGEASYDYIPNSKNFQVLTDSNLTMVISAEGHDNTDYLWDTSATFNDEVAWIDEDLLGTTTSKVTISLNAQIETQTNEVAWNAQANNGPPYPDFDNLEILETGMENSSQYEGQSFLQVLNAMVGGTDILKLPFIIVIGFQDVRGIAAESPTANGWQEAGRTFRLLGYGLEYIMVSKLVLLAAGSVVFWGGTWGLLTPANLKVLGWMYAAWAGIKAIGYGLDAIGSETGAAKARNIKQMLNHAESAVHGLAIAKLALVYHAIYGGAWGLAVVGSYAAFHGTLWLLGEFAGNPLAAQIAANPLSSLGAYYFGSGIISEIIDYANGNATERFYEYYCYLAALGYENIILVPPEETITDGCTTSCGQNYTKSNCYEEPNSSSSSGGGCY